MKNKVLILLFCALFIGVMGFSRTYANSQFEYVGSKNNSNYYFDTTTLTVTKDDNNQIYYDVWIIAERAQEIQELKLSTNQYEPSKLTVYHFIIIVTPDKKTLQILSATSYTSDDKIIDTYAPMEPKTIDIKDGTLGNALVEYISKMNPRPYPHEKYLPITEKEFFDLFEARGYKFNKIEEVQKYNPYKGTNYTAFSTPYSFFDNVVEKEVNLYVSGEDNQHLKIANIQFALEGPNYEQRDKKFNLPSEEKLNLFYMMLQVLYPDWPKEESKKWVDDSIATMNQKNTLMFIYLHKDREYIKISRQPVQKDEEIVYILDVSQQRPPSFLNLYYPYYENEKSHVFFIYEEWKELQSNKQTNGN